MTSEPTNQPNTQPSHPATSEMREKLQQDIVNIITKKLESGEMTEERAKAIAKMTLEKLPEDITYDQFMKVVPTLDDEFEELKVAVLPIVLDYQSKVEANVQTQVSELMKHRRYTEALDLAKKAIEFDSNLR